MVSDACPEHLSGRGSALFDAGSDILGIGQDLMRYLERVGWGGEGAESFRAWGAQFAREAVRLGTHGMGLGEGMVNAGQGLAEVKAAMPEPSVSAPFGPRSALRRSAPARAAARRPSTRSHASTPTTASRRQNRALRKSPTSTRWANGICPANSLAVPCPTPLLPPS